MRKMKISVKYSRKINPAHLRYKPQRMMRYFRSLLNLSQVEFAEIVGVSNNTIMRWEIGQSRVKKDMMRLVERNVDRYINQYVPKYRRDEIYAMMKEYAATLSAEKCTKS